MKSKTKQKIIRITTVPESLRILLKGQLRFMNSHFEVIGISCPGSILEEVSKSEGIQVLPLKMTRKITPLRDFIALLKLIVILRKYKPDIVHTHTPKAGLLGMLASFFTKVPIRLHTVAGIPLMEATGFKKKILIIVEKLTYKCSTNIYPNSIKLKEYILENEFTDKNKLKVLGNGSSNGIDTTFFNSTNEVQEKADFLKKKLEIPDNAFIYLFIGRIVTDKGINELISSFINISKNVEKVFLVLVGNFESELDPLKKETVEIINIESKIITTGYQKDIRPYLGLADILVFPSYREGFPNVVLQAGSMNIPCIVSNINGCNEIIEHEKNGLIVKVKDIESLKKTMIRILNNYNLIKKLKSNCRSKIVLNYERTYVWDQMLNEYNKLLKDV